MLSALLPSVEQGVGALPCLPLTFPAHFKWVVVVTVAVITVVTVVLMSQGLCDQVSTRTAIGPMEV